MHALSEQFLLLDEMRKAAGIAPARLAHRARMPWLRYQAIRAGLEAPRRRDIKALARALRDAPPPESSSRAFAPSKHEPAGRPAPHRNGPVATSAPALARGLRAAVPVANSGEGHS